MNRPCTCARILVPRKTTDYYWKPGPVNLRPEHAGYFWAMLWDRAYCDAHGYVGYDPGYSWMIVELTITSYADRPNEPPWRSIDSCGSDEGIRDEEIAIWGQEVKQPWMGEPMHWDKEFAKKVVEARGDMGGREQPHT